jgi:hypothetical protein
MSLHYNCPVTLERCTQSCPENPNDFGLLCFKQQVLQSAETVRLRAIDGNSQPPTQADTAPVRTAQVIRWQGITRHDLPVDRILDAARQAELGCVVVLGYTERGVEYFASSMADGADVVWLLERCKQTLLTIGIEPDPV